MKKFIVAVSVIVAAYILFDFAYYQMGWYLPVPWQKEVETFMSVSEDKIYMDTGDGPEEFEIRGVNMGSGIPGKWSTEFAIDKETYLRWFKYIQEMGANTIRIYTIQSDDFYNAFYEYNEGNENPLYLIHGVWVSDYVQNSHKDAYDKDFKGTFEESCRTMVDVIHGKRTLRVGYSNNMGSGKYRNDISQWVIGYILGVEWEDITVSYTDEKYKDDNRYNSYSGKYMFTTVDASPFEAMLAEAGDKIIEYETERYGQQRLIAFSNWPTTDPFDYTEDVAEFFMKCAKVDVEHIRTTDEFVSGQFASYHVYPYYPDYFEYVDIYDEDFSAYGIQREDLYDEDGQKNTYGAYLKALKKYHTMPVVISEFGVSTGRGMAQRDANTGRNQGNMSEYDQGQAVIDCWKDLKSAGCAGGCVFSWQDEWFKRTWNTMYAINLKRTPFWSDYQTNEQYFGLLAFDPGKEQSVCYVDGDVSEWSAEDIVAVNGDMSVSAKYDEKFVYLLVNKKDFRFSEETLYIPVDTTPKSGSDYCQNYDLMFDKAADFLITINGKNDSRIQVQERYEALRSTYSQNVYQYDTYEKANIPDKDSPKFVNIDMILQTATALQQNDNTAPAETFETGKLTCGNGNPSSEDFNSLADFMVNGDNVEIRIPWQLLNFADPSEMKIHDDYYEHYGVEHIEIEEMYLGVTDGSGKERTELKPLVLEGWDGNVTYHERLKKSYYIIKDYWTKGEQRKQ